MPELRYNFSNNNFQANFVFEHFKVCFAILFTKYRHYNSQLKEKLYHAIISIMPLVTSL